MPDRGGTSAIPLRKVCPSAETIGSAGVLSSASHQEGELKMTRERVDPSCERCSRTMDLVADIPSVKNKRGIRIYFCPNCEGGTVIASEPEAPLERPV